MAGNLATKQEYKAGCDFRRFNGEFQQHIVDWGFYINNKNTVASQNSCGCESLIDKNTVKTPLTTLTTASNEAETRMNSGFAGGVYLTSSPTRLSHTSFKNVNDLTSYRLIVLTSLKETQVKILVR